VSFCVIHLAPGTPTVLEQSLNPKVSRETRERLDALYGLDKPLHVQYLRWLRRTVSLDFGESFSDQQPVMRKILDRLPLTVGINAASLLISLAAGILLGIRCSRAPGRFFDRACTAASFAAFSAPTFWIALIAIQFFCVSLGWFPLGRIASLDYEMRPVTGKILDVSWHLALPVLISSIGGTAVVMRYMRNSMLFVLQQPYITAARAKGLPQRRIFLVHALKNAILPIITLVGLSIPGLLGGSVIFESIFALPGVGRLFYEAVMTRDYPLIMAEVVLTGVLTMIGNLLADIGYALADPRIRYGR
jgi:peptide/nickel transport system permease protein